MLKLICWVVVIIGVAIAGLLALRALDLRGGRDGAAHSAGDAAEKRRRVSRQIWFAGLPDAAQRYFLHSIAPGAPLLTVARIDMDGDFSLGTTADDPYLAMNATQVFGGPAWVCLVGCFAVRRDAFGGVGRLPGRQKLDAFLVVGRGSGGTGWRQFRSCPRRLWPLRR